MKNFSNTYIFIYVSILVVVMVVLLSGLTLGLKSRQEMNFAADKASQILRAAGYDEMSGKDAADLFAKVAVRGEGEKECYTMQCADGTTGTVVRVDGKGLWGPIWGYVVIAQDGKTIKGVTFSHKSETPGLGANITEEKFQSQFVGKSLYDAAGRSTSVRVLKPGREPQVAAANRVDAITGATLTSNGVDAMLQQLPALLDSNRQTQPATR